MPPQNGSEDMSGSPNPAEEPWAPNELVVALPHLPVVLDELGKLPQPVANPEVKESPILDLALITIADVGIVASQITDLPSPCEHHTHRRTSEEDAIERVIRAIRESCRQQHGGWMATIGKNRTLDGVHTTQHVGIGGAASPPSLTVRTDLGDLATDGTDKSADPPVAGLIDTALWAHPDLEGRYRLDETDVLLASDEPFWYTEGHATFVAGMILQDSPNVELLARKGLKSDGTALAWDIAEEMVVLARRVDVLNVSFACFTSDNEEPLVLARMVELISRDKVIVAAAGNFADSCPGNGRRAPTSPNSPMWPAASSRVIAVGAHKANGKRAPFSPRTPWIDLSARGVDVASTYLSGKVASGENQDAKTDHFEGYARWTGTSFAAALASGAIARRIRHGGSGVTAQEALQQVLDLPIGNSEDVWRYDAATDEQ